MSKLSMSCARKFSKPYKINFNLSIHFFLGKYEVLKIIHGYQITCNGENFICIRFFICIRLMFDVVFCCMHTAISLF